MTTGAKIADLRRERHYTQEQLAVFVGVEPETVRAWELDSLLPETDELIRLCDLFGCTADYLLRGSVENPTSAPETPEWEVSPHRFGVSFSYAAYPSARKEYISKHKLFGLPLVHICFDPHKTAKGCVAVGVRAKGLLSWGVFSVGLLSGGVFSCGCVSFGSLSLGLLALGAVAVGLFAAGAIAVGLLMAVGAVAVGSYAWGALGVGIFAAWGDQACSGGVAIGQNGAQGGLISLLQQEVRTGITAYLTPQGKSLSAAQVRELILTNAPAWLRWLAVFFTGIL